MHEMGLVRDILERAEDAADGEAVIAMRLRVGLLAGAAPDYLREYINREAAERWGHRPAVEIEESADPTDPDALGVMLVSVET